MVFRSPFKLEKKFVRELRKRLISINKSHFGNNSPLGGAQSIPNLRHLEQIISEMFWASTQFEEGRSLRFRASYSIAFTTPEHLGFSFDFRNFRPWNAEEIRRLAPATAPPYGTIYFFSGDPHDPNFLKRNLYIEGLGKSNGFAVEFEILDPARIVVRFPFNTTIAEIKPSDFGFVDSGWSERIWDLMSSLAWDEENEHKSRMFRVLSARLTAETLKRIRLLRHGGTLIFVDDDKKWRRSVERSSTSPFVLHPFNGFRHLAEGLKARLDTHIVSGRKSNQGLSRMLLDGYNLLADDRFSAYVDDAATTMAHLSAVDGAVVASDDFDVLGFGVKISEPTRVVGDQPFDVYHPMKGSKLVR